MGTSQWVHRLLPVKAECAILARVEDGKVKEIRATPSRTQSVREGCRNPSHTNSDLACSTRSTSGRARRGQVRAHHLGQALDTIAKKLNQLKGPRRGQKLTASFFPHSINDPQVAFPQRLRGILNTALPHCDSAKIVAFLRTVGGYQPPHSQPGSACARAASSFWRAARLGGLDNAASARHPRCQGARRQAGGS